MRPSEAAKLLAATAAWDRRTIGEVDAQAWANSLDELPLEECTAAIAAHFRACPQATFLMPAHVREHVITQRREEAQYAHDRAVFDEIDRRKALAGPPHSSERERSLTAMRVGRAHLNAVLEHRRAGGFDA